MLFNIIPDNVVIATIEADSKEQAMDAFVWAMDSDMNCYFKAVPTEVQKEYTFKVRLCDGYLCGGVVTVKANNEDDACQQALDYICTKLNAVLPELDIEVSVELCDEE